MVQSNLLCRGSGRVVPAAAYVWCRCRTITNHLTTCSAELYKPASIETCFYTLHHSICLDVPLLECPLICSVWYSIAVAQHLSQLYHSGQVLQPPVCGVDYKLVQYQQNEHHLTTDGVADSSSLVSSAVAPLEQLQHVERLNAATVCAALLDGYSLVVHGVPSRHAVVAVAAEQLEWQWGLPVGANMYLTPAGGCGTAGVTESSFGFLLLQLVYDNIEQSTPSIRHVVLLNGTSAHLSS